MVSGIIKCSANILRQTWCLILQMASRSHRIWGDVSLVPCRRICMTCSYAAWGNYDPCTSLWLNVGSYFLVPVVYVPCRKIWWFLMIMPLSCILLPIAIRFFLCPLRYQPFIMAFWYAKERFRNYQGPVGYTVSLFVAFHTRSDRHPSLCLSSSLKALYGK